MNPFFQTQNEDNLNGLQQELATYKGESLSNDRFRGKKLISVT